MALGPYGNCKLCFGRLAFFSGPNKSGKYVFSCIECGAKTYKEAVPAQFESEYVDRLIRCGQQMHDWIVGEGYNASVEPMSGWRALVALRDKEPIPVEEKSFYGGRKTPGVQHNARKQTVDNGS